MVLVVLDSVVDRSTSTNHADTKVHDITEEEVVAVDSEEDVVGDGRYTQRFDTNREIVLLKPGLENGN